PLQILVEANFARQLAPRFRDGRRLTPLQRVWPLRPGAFAFARMQRTEDRVVFDPPRLLAQKRRQLAAAHGTAAPLGFGKTREGGAQRRLFQPSDFLVSDRRRAPDLVEGVFVDQRRLPAERLK